MGGWFRAAFSGRGVGEGRLGKQSVGSGFRSSFPSPRQPPPPPQFANWERQEGWGRTKKIESSEGPTGHPLLFPCGARTGAGGSPGVGMAPAPPGMGNSLSGGCMGVSAHPGILGSFPLFPGDLAAPAGTKTRRSHPPKGSFRRAPRLPRPALQSR